MLVMRSADEIGEYGYAHWTHQPVTPGQHSIATVPQSMADGWEAYCSCGEWRAFASFYEYPSREGLLAALRGAFDQHVASHADAPRTD